MRGIIEQIIDKDTKSFGVLSLVFSVSVFSYPLIYCTSANNVEIGDLEFILLSGICLSLKLVFVLQMMIVVSRVSLTCAQLSQAKNSKLIEILKNISLTKYELAFSGLILFCVLSNMINSNFSGLQELIKIAALYALVFLFFKLEI